jgi:hypothetical protein
MSSKPQIGSIVYGKAGVGCRVLEIEGDVLTVQTAKGEGKISLSRVVRVQLRPLALGDRARYIGTHHSFQKQYGGILMIWEFGRGCDLDKCACLTPSGKVSTWIEYSALELMEEA